MNCPECEKPYFTLILSDNGDLLYAYCVECESQKGIQYEPTYVFQVLRTIKKRKRRVC